MKRDFIIKVGFLFAALFFTNFIFIPFIETYADQNKGQIVSIGPDGSVFINLGAHDGVEVGDLIEIYDGGAKILELQVKDVFGKISKLHPPKRRELTKLRIGLQVIPLLQDIEISAIQGEIVSFDPAEEAGFVNLGIPSGITEGMGFDVLRGEDVVAKVKVSRVFGKISKVALIEKKPEVKELTGLKVRQEAVREKPRVGMFKHFLRKFREKFSVESRSILTNYRIEGDTSQSFYPARLTTYREEIDLKHADTPAKDVTTETYGSFRFTDDGYVDSQNAGIESLYFDSKVKNLDLRLGDFLSDFTSYTLYTSLKGIKAGLEQKNFLGTFNALGVYGTNKARWEYFWNRIPGSSYAQNVSGFRVSQDFRKKYVLGLNFANTQDDKDSSGAPNTVTRKNRVFSVDLNSKPFEGLSVDSEWAMSWQRYNRAVGEVRYKDDTAYIVDANYAIEGWNFRNKYERVGALFRAISGTPSTDREEYYSQVKYKFSDVLSGKLGYRFYHDNLKKLLANTTKYHNYDGSATFRPFEKLFPDFELDYEFDLRQVHSDSVDNYTLTNTFGGSNRTGIFSYSTYYTWVEKIDDITPTNSREKDIIDMDIKSNHKIGKLRIMPSASYEIERDEQRSTDELDIFHNVRLGLNLYIGDNTTFNCYYTYSLQDYYVYGRDLNKKVYDAKFKTYLFGNRDSLLEVSFKRNDFVREDEIMKSVAENIFESRFILRF